MTWLALFFFFFIESTAIGACVRLLQNPTTPLDVQGSTLEVRRRKLLLLFEKIVSRTIEMSQFKKILLFSLSLMKTQVLAKFASEKTETQFAVEQQALNTALSMLSTAGSTDVQCQVRKIWRLEILRIHNNKIIDQF